MFAAAIPLAVFAAVVYRRLRQLGVTPGAAIGWPAGCSPPHAFGQRMVIWTAAASPTRRARVLAR